LDHRIRAAIEVMRANLSKRMSIAEMARAVNMSRGRFCRVFKAHMSLSPSLYIKSLRMREAEKMLSETFLSVKEIRAELGNLDRGRFSRDFKQFCGFTPTQFRTRLTGDSHTSPTHYAAD
jgi:transcriptional regulator GlxA family with amidase domain